MPPPSIFAATGHPLAVSIPNPFSVGSDQLTKTVVNAVTKAINAFFGGLVNDALNPLLTLLGKTLLTTPDPSALPRVGQLWENSRQIAVAVYALIILTAGILVMAYETLQTRQGIKEIAPRLVVGFITANMSLLLAGKAVSFANALSTGLLGQGVDATSAAGTLTSLVLNAVTNGGIFLSFIGIGLACVLLALLVGYVIRVALTVILITGAPLALMCHALPQTEGIARWWWRTFAGVLAIQIVQSLTLVAAMNVFLTPGGFSFFGPTADGLVNVIVTFALLYILHKIPFWILHSVQVGGGRSMLGGAVKGLIAYKTLGLMGLGGGGSGAGRPGGRPGPAGGGPRRGPRPGGPAPSGSGQPRRPRPVGPSSGAARMRSAPGSAVRSQAAPGALAASNPVAPRMPASNDRAASSPATPLAPAAVPPASPTRSRVSVPASLTEAPRRAIPVAHRPTGAAPPRPAALSRPAVLTGLGPTAPARPTARPRVASAPATGTGTDARVRPSVDLAGTTRRRPTRTPPPAPKAQPRSRRGDDAR
ncbi:hypothetical protein [Jatrophihabitans lederbergiae]|uniref:Type IV secretion system protein n=1 Tax=Jatrophihabitans lederbergiae TaxID=3075547 RepID=A0ABU2JFI0_9ACTN|nr:hypothetical protein [Jatrophihabitans sp. DSM 44399]MDT0263761.1 hypothetical protein [Jatrophihabitans sp. DSM 44399]